MADVEIAGKRMPRWAAFAVIAGGLGAGAIIWHQHKLSTAAATASAAGDGTTAADPSQDTGYTDQSGTPVSAVNASNGTVTQSAYGTNAQWSQAAQAGLAEIGYDPVAVAEALGLYLSGQPLTTTQASIVRVALAEFGPPPQGQLPIISAPTAGHQGHVLDAPGEPSVTIHDGHADIGWGAVTGAAVYELMVEGPTHIDRVTAGNHAEGVALHPGAYSVSVRAGVSTTDIHGHWSAARHFTVPRPRGRK